MSSNGKPLHDAHRVAGDDAHLKIERLSAGYGDVAVLHDIDIEVCHGEILAIVGANGAGKTTLMSVIAGLIVPFAGRLIMEGKDITGLQASDRTSHGMALVPEGGRLFPFMTVEENLQLGAYAPHSRGSIDQRMARVMEIFPILSERRTQLAGRLSGGERQMCAIARALMSKPRLLLLDEPSVGLSPLMTERVLEAVSQLVAEESLTAIIVEQRVTEVLAMAHYAHILDHGRIIMSGEASKLRADPKVRETYMGL